MRARTHEALFHLSCPFILFSTFNYLIYLRIYLKILVPFWCPFRALSCPDILKSLDFTSLSSIFNAEFMPFSCPFLPFFCFFSFNINMLQFTEYHICSCFASTFFFLLKSPFFLLLLAKPRGKNLLSASF